MSLTLVRGSLNEYGCSDPPYRQQNIKVLLTYVCIYYISVCVCVYLQAACTSFWSVCAGLITPSTTRCSLMESLQLLSCSKLLVSQRRHDGRRRQSFQASQWIWLKRVFWPFSLLPQAVTTSWVLCLTWRKAWVACRCPRRRWRCSVLLCCSRQVLGCPFTNTHPDTAFSRAVLKPVNLSLLAKLYITRPHQRCFNYGNRKLVGSDRHIKLFNIHPLQPDIQLILLQEAMKLADIELPTGVWKLAALR